MPPLLWEKDLFYFVAYACKRTSGQLSMNIVHVIFSFFQILVRFISAIGILLLIVVSLLLRDGVTVPMGPAVETGVGKNRCYSLLYNEFIVYNPAQTRMRYLLRIKFNYSSLW